EIKAGILGSILATRARSRGATGIVTDGAVRDSAAVSDSGIAVFVTATNPNLSSMCHHPVDYNVEIACGGVLVRPGDVIVGDDDGVVVIPSGAAGELIEDAVKQERLGGYLLDR